MDTFATHGIRYLLDIWIQNKHQQEGEEGTSENSERLKEKDLIDRLALDTSDGYNIKDRQTN